MSESVVDEEDVRHVATLARIELTEEDVATFKSEFAEILDYFERLDDVPDIAVADRDKNVLREDTVTRSLSQERALENADETEDGFFKGPSVS